MEIMILWLKIAVACVPAAIVGLLFDDIIEEVFYNYQTVTFTLILYGVLFVVIERRHRDMEPKIRNLNDLNYIFAFGIGLFQLLALIPGTSRSGATILGAVILGASRTIAAEFTFFLAIPVMFGASLLKIMKFGWVFTSTELMILAVGMLVAFVVSILVIKFLMGYIKNTILQYSDTIESCLVLRYSCILCLYSLHHNRINEDRQDLRADSWFRTTCGGQIFSGRLHRKR